MDHGVCNFGASVILKHLEALQIEIPGVRQAEDIECIHRMRVASRRLHNAMTLFTDCLPSRKKIEWLKETRQVRRALGAARDLDVQIERVTQFDSQLTDVRQRPGIRRLVLRLRQQRIPQQRKVLRALDTLEASHVGLQMDSRLRPQARLVSLEGNYCPALYQRGYDAIHSALAGVLKYDAIVAQPEKKLELHAMRIAAKHLRYTLETMAPLYGGSDESQLLPFIQIMRKTQDALGEIHDCDVWTAFLPEFISDERQLMLDYYGHAHSFNRLTVGLFAFQAACEASRGAEYQGFARNWEKWKENQVWEDLAAIIQAPFSPPPSAASPTLPPLPPSLAAEDAALPNPDLEGGE
jgi:CHAD domain-containing protein